MSLHESRLTAAQTAFDAAGGYHGASLKTANEFRRAWTAHEKAKQKQAGIKGVPLDQPPAVYGKPELTGNGDPKQLNWARGIRDKALDQHEGGSHEAVAREYFENMKDAGAIISNRDDHDANILKRRPDQAEMGEQRTAPAPSPKQPHEMMWKEWAKVSAVDPKRDMAEKNAVEPPCLLVVDNPQFLWCISR